MTANTAQSSASGAARWRVHKFGGSSVADAACMRRVADILEADPCPRIGVVLSACKGVTDALLNLVSQAEQQAPVDDAVRALRQRHVELAQALLPADRAAAFGADLDRDLQDIVSILHAVRITRSASRVIRDLRSEEHTSELQSH